MSNLSTMIARKTAIAKQELLSDGYTMDEMDMVFGEEDFYFPTTTDKSNQTKGILGNLVSNNQIKETDKKRLGEMIEDAYEYFVKAGKSKKPKRIPDHLQPSKPSTTDEIEMNKKTKAVADTWWNKNKLWVYIGGGTLLLGTIITIVVVSKKRSKNNK
tara:strand:- start:197 stop:670 length:474 start_codon:yes stop_codon:yes gene_type:complete